MKRSRTGVPRLPARVRSRPRTVARKKLGRRRPPTLAVRSGDTAPPDQPPPAAVRQPPALPPLPQAPPATRTAGPKSEVAAPVPQVAPPVPEVAPQVRQPARPAAATAAANAMVLRGEVWDVRFDGHTLMLDGTRGLRYIALLIRDAR